MVAVPLASDSGRARESYGGFEHRASVLVVSFRLFAGDEKMDTAVTRFPAILAPRLSGCHSFSNTVDKAGIMDAEGFSNGFTVGIEYSQYFGAFRPALPSGPVRTLGTIRD